MRKYTDSDTNRFWNKVEKSAASGCWNWIGGWGAYKSKIPVFWDGETQRNAIKVCYDVLSIEVPKTSKFIRTCGNPFCINPEHVIPDSLENRLWGNVDKNGPINRYTGDNCWIWKGGTERAGYGRISINNTTIRPHVAAMIVSGVDVPSNAYICHHCDNRLCVRPSHLYVGDAATNGNDRKMRPKPIKRKKVNSSQK